MLKVSPWKGVVRFAKKGKLTPRYVGPFEIIERIGPVAYRLNLPDELSGVHDVFHVSNLKKCLADKTLIIPVEEIQLDEHLRFVEEPLEIMDRKVKKLRRSRIPIVKVRWNSRHGPEFTWEREYHMKNKYPQLFTEEAVEFSVLGVHLKPLISPTQKYNGSGRISNHLRELLSAYMRYVIAGYVIAKLLLVQSLLANFETENKSYDQERVEWKILELLKEEKLYAKFSKCKFFLREFQFLGHVVNSEGIHVDPAKIEAIKNWDTPKTPAEIRSFL
ncbi:hypothetical protein E3N88_15627 [Mikania micrantha]|uniref:Tf2-1-like SH3-like domain-containing protein n=1 Tax=Mikania micrantha TaxID=192012 RepID=A0A5N6NXA5_9ASTR|nr:hypothetical protein E3N88_15627 [Mikania micrantha]